MDADRIAKKVWLDKSGFKPMTAAEKSALDEVCITAKAELIACFVRKFKTPENLLAILGPLSDYAGDPSMLDVLEQSIERMRALPETGHGWLGEDVPRA
jgi:hypothetical protein